MSRTRSSLLTAAVAAILIIATALPAGAEHPGGFLLRGADAAYADWIGEGVADAGGLTGCDASLFVGFVEAESLQQPVGSLPAPHSDVAATLGVNCNEGSWVLQGVVQATDCDTRVMVSLQSAALDCDLPITDGEVSAVLEIDDLAWTAEGNIFREQLGQPGVSFAAHRTRTASVLGDVEITAVIGNAGLATLIGGYGFTGTDVDEARITRFNEIHFP